MAIITDEQIIKTIRTYNPWWRTASSIKEFTKPHKRSAYYEALKIIRHESIRRFVVLSGARRVGKTTIMNQMMDELIENGVNPRNLFYVSFDNPMVKLVTMDKVIELYESLFPVDGTKYFFFDEIQYATDWELWMKVLYDSRQDIRIVATGSASPKLDQGTSDSGTGRWSVLKIPTLSFYEYCRLLELKSPELPDNLRITELVNWDTASLSNLMDSFAPLLAHFNRYLTIGGFPELVLAKDDAYAQRSLREDVVDKVLKRDIPALFNIRNPLLMEKLFLYLCIISTDILNVSTVSKELENTSTGTIETYLDTLVRSNLVYISNPIDVSAKGALKGKPKVYIADPAIRNAVLLIDDIMEDEAELGKIVETSVYKHMVSFFQGTPVTPGYFRKAINNQKEVDVVVEQTLRKTLCEVKYRNNSHIPENDAIVELCKDKNSSVQYAFVITKRLDDCGITKHNTEVPILRIPALPLLYILGKMEADGNNGKL